MATALQCEILKKKTQQQKKQEVQAKVIPPMPKDLNDYRSPIWIVLHNKSQFEVAYKPGPDEFWAGCFHGENPGVSAWDISGFGVRNKATFLGAGYGPSGGIAFSVQLDESHSYDFTIGFENPLVGSYKAAVVEGIDRKGACDKAFKEVSGGSITSGKYTGKNDDEEQETFKLNITATPGSTLNVTISQDSV